MSSAGFWTPVHARRQQPEAQLQRAVLEHMRCRGVPGLFAFHPPNGGARSPVEGAILQGLGVVAGVPDVFLIYRGKTFGLELKPERGRLTTVQIATHEAMRAAGAIIATA